MEVRGLTDETYCAMALLSLRQQSLMKIATTLLSNHHHELVDVMLQLQVVERTEQGYGDWNDLWMHFKGKLSHKINQLHFPHLDVDIREQVMCLLCNVSRFKYLQILNPAIRFTPRGNLDVSIMFEDYVSARSFHDLPRPEKYDLLRAACCLYQDRCIQLILCDLLLWRNSQLEPFLRNAVRLTEVDLHGPYHRPSVIDISFHLEVAGDPASWLSFVDILNNKFRVGRYNENIVFSFEQNVMMVSISAGLNSNFMFLWPKLTQLEKATHAENFCLCALYPSDAYLLVDVMRFLDSVVRTRFLKNYLIAFILSFLKHPHDRFFVPDFQLQELMPCEADCQLPTLSTMRIMKRHTQDIFLEGTFCSRRRDCFVKLWRYFSSRNTLFGDAVLDRINWALEMVLHPWLRNEPHTDANKAILEFYELHF